MEGYCIGIHPAAVVSSDAIDVDCYRLAQAAELQIWFREVQAGAAKDRAELTAWLDRSDLERPVVPGASLLDTYLD